MVLRTKCPSCESKGKTISLAHNLKRKKKNYKDKESFVWGQIVGNNAHNRIVGAYLKCKGVEAIKK